MGVRFILSAVTLTDFFFFISIFTEGLDLASLASSPIGRIASTAAPEYSYNQHNQHNSQHQHQHGNPDSSNYLHAEDIPFDRSLGFTEVTHRDMQGGGQGGQGGAQGGAQQRGSVRRNTEASYEAAELPSAGVQDFLCVCLFILLQQPCAPF